MTVTDPKAITEMFIIAVVVTCVIFNLFMRLAFGPQATISVVLQDAASKFPVIAAAVGLLVGHVFWPVR